MLPYKHFITFTWLATSLSNPLGIVHLDNNFMKVLNDGWWSIGTLNDTSSSNHLCKAIK